ncbi:MAG: NAD(P)-dependent alcohol dehydrogenase [Pirellulaceae bacterium]|nr:NAD(P)-dependent alcohol dehydrogenase [Pirellulaceae bacterium]
MLFKAWVYRDFNSAYRLEIVDRPELKLEDSQVRVAIRGVSLNYRDVIALKNKAGRKVDGRIAASDGSGEIIEIGKSVTEWRVGDRVAGCFFPTWKSGRFDLGYHREDLGGSLDGMLAEQVVVDQDGLVEIPNQLSFAEAATLPCAAVTAWHALVIRGSLQSGQTVLVLGTGGVSIFALQIANAMGAKVIVTSSSDEKLEKAKAMGAWATIHYGREPDWDREVWKLTDGKGVDHVVETGGPGTLERSMKSIAAEGKIALIGVLTGFGPPTASLFPLLARNVSLNGIYVGSRQHFKELNQFLTQSKIHPVIDSQFAFDEAPTAFESLEDARHFGKIVIKGLHA